MNLEDVSVGKSGETEFVGMSGTLTLDKFEAAHPEVADAILALSEGKMVLVFDAEGREEETDMMVASQFVTPGVIRTMRKHAGGLICTTMTAGTREKLGLPYLSDLIQGSSDRFPALSGLIPDDIPYDEVSAFSLTINHRRTFTGITDEDRAMTITTFAELAGECGEKEAGWCRQELGARFRSPGHVHLLTCSPWLLVKRQGHTELTTALTIMARLTRSATICEMMGDDGKARNKASASRWAEEHGYPYLEGKHVLEAWRAWSGY